MAQNSIEVFANYRKEFMTDENGIGYSSKKGLGRMCGVSINLWGKEGRIFNKKIDEMLEKQGFGGVENWTNKQGQILDLVCFAVIQYYGFQGSEIAQQNALAIGAMGMRTLIQRVTNWHPVSKYEAHILKTPREWTRIFGDEFYDELSRLTGLTWDRKTHRRPCIFAYLTYELVYKYLPVDVYQKIKANQKAHGGYIHKMHQFLDEEGLKSLQFHLVSVLCILTASSHIESAKRLVSQSVTKNYQYSLFIGGV